MLPYDADHVITVEELRELVYDDDADNELFDDDRYDVWIARYPTDWRRAALAAADRVLMEMASRPNRLASDGDSIGWSDQRIAILRDRYAELLADINADGYGEDEVITSRYLTGPLPAYLGGDEWQ